MKHLLGLILISIVATSLIFIWQELRINQLQNLLIGQGQVIQSQNELIKELAENDTLIVRKLKELSEKQL